LDRWNWWNYFGGIIGSNKHAAKLPDPHDKYHKVLRTHFKKLPRGVTLQAERLRIGALFEGWRIEGPLSDITPNSRNIVLKVTSAVRGDIVGALKLPSPKNLIEAPTEKVIFDQEQKLTRSLVHTNLAGALDDGVVAGLPYLITEKYEGNFADHAPTGDTRTTWHVITQVATGIEHMHTTRALIHGDIKPQNIMVTRRAGTLAAKVIDFGSATPVATDQQIAKVLTPAYARPGVRYGSLRMRHDDTYAIVVTLMEKLVPTTLTPLLAAISDDEDPARCQEMVNMTLKRLVHDSDSIPDDTKAAILAVLNPKNPAPPELKDLIPLFEKAANEAKR
jgi:serine/threonine protein kinase